VVQFAPSEAEGIPLLTGLMGTPNCTTTRNHLSSCNLDLQVYNSCGSVFLLKYHHEI
jgi:hypothetical protein